MDEAQQKCRRLILLPGMDGTGRLMKWFVDELKDEVNTSIIRFPSGQDQSYEFLTGYVREQLPLNAEIVLLAESFSGPIAYRLLQEEKINIVSVIFVASFIKTPGLRVRLASRLVPRFLMKKSFLTNLAAKALLPDLGSEKELFQTVWEVIDEVGPETLKRRMKAISSLPEPSHRICKPCFYIQAEDDFFVPGLNFSEFEKHFDNIKLYRIKGPHLVLQARPRECAAIVRIILTP